MDNRTICKVYEGLYWLSQEKNLKLKPKIAFILAKDKMLLEPYYKTIKDCEKQLWEQYGKYDDNGNLVANKDEVEIINSSYEELMSQDNDIKLGKVSIDDFGEEAINFSLLEKIVDIIN